MLSYIALMRKERGSVYGVDFPDFPGCVSAGNTMEEARRNAQEALEMHIEGMMEDGETIPKPSALEVIMKDPDNRESLVIAFLTTLPPIKSRSVRINITVQESVLEKMDEYVREHEEVKNRSDFLAKAAEDYITRHKRRYSGTKSNVPGKPARKKKKFAA